MGNSHPKELLYLIFLPGLLCAFTKDIIDSNITDAVLSKYFISKNLKSDKPKSFKAQSVKQNYHGFTNKEGVTGSLTSLI